MDSADAFGLSPKIEAVEDVVAALDLAAPDQRLELLRDSLKKYGTVIPTVALCLESKAGGEESRTATNFRARSMSESSPRS